MKQQQDSSTTDEQGRLRIIVQKTNELERLLADFYLGLSDQEDIEPVDYLREALEDSLASFGAMLARWES